LGNPNRVPALMVGGMVVTAGTATGERYVVPVGGTPAAPHAAGVPGIATISADGKTLVVEANITAFIITYIPRPAVDMNGAFTRA
jgi:hypothetical protein